MSKTQQVVLIVDSIHGGYLDDTEVECAVLGPDVDVRLVAVESLDEAPLEGADALICWHLIALPRTALLRLSECRGVVRASVGFDNIDIVAANALGVPVCNVPDYGTEEVADHTIMLMLMLARDVLPVIDGARDGTWHWQSARHARRTRGRRLGIVGLGRIGTAVAMRASAFGMDVSFFDPFVVSGTDKALGITRAETLQELLQQSDVLTLHTPLTDATAGLIGAGELAVLPKGAVLLNTARGGLVDHGALALALEGGAVGGAGLDVLATEPDVPAALARHPRVVLTAHSAFFSGESLIELRHRAAVAAGAFLARDGRTVAPMRDELHGGGVRSAC